MTVKRVVNALFGSCSYVVETGDAAPEVGSAWVVDCGDVEPLVSALGGRRPVGVLLTHGHFDHIYGLNELLMRFPDILVFTNEDARDALLDARKNMSRYHETPFVFHCPENIRLIKDGDVIELAEGLTAKVVATPGHHPSCLTFVVDDAVFTGDAYLPGIKVTTILPGGDKVAAAGSIELIRGFMAGRSVYPGHAV